MTRSAMLPFFRPYVSDEEAKAVAETVLSGWLSMGPRVAQFEGELEKYVGAKHVVSVNSCTAALHLSLLAHGVGKGDEVITTPYTFTSTVNVIENMGATPVFADVLDDSFNIDPDEIKKKITGKTKAIIPVHFAGQACRMEEIMGVANGIPVIEDAAHAIGTTYKGKKVGSRTDTITCFSFYAIKNITTGEGGAIATSDDKIAERVSRLRLHGMDRDAWQRYSAKNKWRYDVSEPGWKYNLTDMQAALGLVQLKKIEEVAAKRRKIAEFYNSKFESVKGFKIPEEVEKGHAWHLYPLRVQGVDRDTFIERMTQQNIGTGVHFIPVHLFSYYRKKYGFKEGDFPIAEKAFNEEVSLPLYAFLSENDLNDVVDAALKSLEGA